jgi:hypothetical protein
LTNREWDKLRDSLSEKGREEWLVQHSKADLLPPGFNQPSPLDTGLSFNEVLRELVKQYPRPVLPSGGAGNRRSKDCSATQCYVALVLLASCATGPDLEEQMNAPPAPDE